MSRPLRSVSIVTQVGGDVQPTPQTMTLHCGVCGHQWEQLLGLPMPLPRAIQAFRGISAAGCPACGKAGLAVLCGPVPKVAT